MAEPTLESLVSPIASLRGAMLVTVEDALLYRAWQRQGERWSPELGAARYHDMLRATRAGLGQLGPSELEQLTIETSDAVTLLQPLSDAVFAILLFDVDTPLGLARHHAARLLGDLRTIASAVGPVGPAASRRASALSASFEEVPPSRPPPPPPTPASSHVTQSAESFPVVVASPDSIPGGSDPTPPVASPHAYAGSSPPAPAGSPPAGSALAGSPMARPSPTLVSDASMWDPEAPTKLPRQATTLVTGSMTSIEAIVDRPPTSEPTLRESVAPGPVPPEPPPPVALPLEDEDTSPEVSQLEPITRPRETSPLPGPERVPESASPGERARELFNHLSNHAPDAHIALHRVALQTGLPSDVIRTPTRIGAHDLALVEAAVRRILGLERLHI